jgi:prepilin-type N-terminal cleavage/methylation domain-containing protein
MSIRCENAGKASKKAFTLVEIMLVSVLMAVLGLTIYGSFSAGSRIWQRAKDGAPEIEAHIFLNRLSQDLRNCFNSSVSAALGTSSSLSFSVLQDSLTSSGQPSVYGK